MVCVIHRHHYHDLTYAPPPLVPLFLVKECLAQGFANLICGLFGAIGGSALIGETVINILHGASVSNWT